MPTTLENPLTSESFLTLKSLAQIDPTGILPISVGLVMFSNIELGRVARPIKIPQSEPSNSSTESSSPSQPKPLSLVSALENGLRGVSILFIWIAMQSPGVSVYHYSSFQY